MHTHTRKGWQPRTHACTAQHLVDRGGHWSLIVVISMRTHNYTHTQTTEFTWMDTQTKSTRLHTQTGIQWTEGATGACVLLKDWCLVLSTANRYRWHLFWAWHALCYQQQAGAGGTYSGCGMPCAINSKQAPVAFSASATQLEAVLAIYQL